VKEETRIRCVAFACYFDVDLRSRFVDTRRIVTWTFIGDWQQGGVTHQPGLATIHEMTGDLPSLPDLWEVNNATEFEAAIAANGPGCWRRTASLRDCADALMAESWSGPEGFPLKHVSLLDLYFLVTGKNPSPTFTSISSD
jgi:hypothetical protein